MIEEELKKELIKVLKELELPLEKLELEHPADFAHGDYSSNVAMIIFGKIKNLGSDEKNTSEVEESRRTSGGTPRRWKNPLELAEKIKSKWEEVGLPDFVQKIEVAPPGFLNIFLKEEFLVGELKEAVEESFGKVTAMAGKKIMVEYAHPNTHKELHIGHMRTLITGEALARIFSAAGAEVFRANYQGDIGPHVSKSIWGTEEILGERKMSWEKAEKLSLAEKAHLLGEGYVRGVQEYEASEKPKSIEAKSGLAKLDDHNKNEIDDLNTKLYQNNASVMPVYERTRRWSLEYYDTFYTRFNTKFDRLFFESEVFGPGKKVVEENTKPAGKEVFKKSEGAIVFEGEKYGLHTRVFVTADGNATYEGKDMALALLQYKAFPFDLNVHVVANEQAGYFKVIIKALELLDPIFIGKEFHLSMGMVQLIGKKMSSRTGVFLRVDDLLDEVKSLLLPLIKKEDLPSELVGKIAEVLTVASVKYSFLRVGPKQDVLFDLQKSVSLEGDSGSYLEYTFARTQSVLRKVQGFRGSKVQSGKHLGRWIRRSVSEGGDSSEVNPEESAILRTIYRFPEVVAEAAAQMAPNLLCNFLYDLCRKYNTFYDKWRIIGEPEEKFRLALTAAVGQIIKNGLNLLGIESLERM